MRSSLLYLLTQRYVLSRRKGGFVSIIAWFSILGIMLGVATLIIVTSLMNGIRHEMLNNFIGVDGHIQIAAYRSKISDADALIASLQSNVPEDARIAPRIEGQVMVSGKANTARGARVISLPSAKLKEKATLFNALSDDAFDAYYNAEGVIIGAGLAEALYLDVGDPITLISPQGRATAFGTVPRIKAYPVVGTIELGMHALDHALVIMPYEPAITYFSYDNQGEFPADIIEVTLADSGQALPVGAALQQALGKDYRVYPWQRSHASVFNALQVQRNVMVIILALIIVVAAFNIISSLVMMVKDKQSDIAILRTMGMEKHDILRLFVMTGMVVGLIGTTLGLVLGVLGATYLEPLKQWLEHMLGYEILGKDVYFLSTLPTRTDPAEVIIVVIASLGLCLLATLYPAYKAASTQPAEALRHG